MAELGERVSISVDGPAGLTNHVGVVLPPAKDGFLTLKLDNGYNVSHPSSMITNMEVLSRQSVNDAATEEITQNASLPLVTIIHTGGTIASKVDYSTGAVVASFEPEELLAGAPELANIAQINAVKIGNMWSDDIRPIHWNQMAKSIKKAFDSGSSGVVVTHGTDTMTISAAAIAFAFSEGLAGPVVFTGSQRSSDRGSSDAAENLIAAVHWAANPQASAQSVTCMHATSDDGTCAIIPGVVSRKMHSTRRDAFQAVNGKPIALVHSDLNCDYLSEQNPRNSSSIQEFDTSIKIAQFVAGPHLNSDLIRSAEQCGYSAVLILGTGLGHLPIEDPNGDAPQNTELLETIRDCSIPVIVGTQCINGVVDMNVYSKGRMQQEIGILGHGTSCSPEALLVKIHWALSQGIDLSETLGKNVVGESCETLEH